MRIDPQGNLFYPTGTLRLHTADSRPFFIDAARQEYTLPVRMAEGPEGVILRQRGNNGTLETFLHHRAETMALVQRAVCAAGVSSVGFTLSVPEDTEVIIPAWSGIRLTKEMPDIHLGFTRLSYPDLWQAQMLLLQNRDGGLLIHAADNGTQFKALTVQHRAGRFYLTLETIPQAPFSGYIDFETREWRLIPYRGGWMQGALLYKDYMEEVFHLSAADAAKPAWADEVGLILLTDAEDPRMLTELAQIVDPSKTLLHIPGWRKQPYDVGYPDYTPDDTIQDRIAFAHRLGYRVSLHFNFIGADTAAPEYQAALSGAHTLDAYTGQPVSERYTAFGRDYAFAQINPASRKWREILTGKVKTAVDTLGADAVHLDQSLLCFNDGRGLVEGLTSMQGNVALQLDLSAALPGIAFSGEGLNEFNARCASWLQMHVYGLDSANRTWEERRFRQICPLGSVLMGDAMRLYHYPAMPATADEAYYAAWYEAGVRMGLMPTLMRISSEELVHPNAAMRRTLRESLWYQRNRPRIHPADWPSDTALELLQSSGGILRLHENNNKIMPIP